MSDTPSAPADGQKVVGDWSRYIGEATERPGWNVDRLASESGVHRATIYRWKNGQVTNVTVDRVKAVARAIGDKESDALLAAGDAVSPTTAEAPSELTSLGLFILQKMAALKIQRPTDLAETAGLDADEITAIMFRPDVDIEPAIFDRLADALNVEARDLDAVRAGESLPVGSPPQDDEQIRELTEMVSSDSPLTDSERRSLRTLVDAAMQPYREKYGDELGARRAC